jgi:hypothetical protein
MKINFKIKRMVLLLLLFVAIFANGQITNQGSLVISGNSINVNGDIVNTTNATLINKGAILLKGNLTNDASFVSEPNSSIKLNGDVQQINGAIPIRFDELIISGTANKELNQNCEINRLLNFENNQLVINDFDITLMPDANISDYSNSKFIVTNGFGKVIKNALSLNVDFTFPVGSSVTDFTPLTLNYSGDIDSFTVNVNDGINPAFFINNQCVQKTFVVEESTAGGANASLTFGWNTSIEGDAFNHLNSTIWQNVNSNWIQTQNNSASTDNLPFTDWKQTASEITDLSESSNKFILASVNLPVVITHPQDTLVCEGQSSSFNIEATGDLLEYQWQMNDGIDWIDLTDDVNYTNTNFDTLNIDNTTIGFNGLDYRCIVSNFAGADTSDNGILNISIPYEINIGDDDTLCMLAEGYGFSTILDVGVANAEYIWSTGETTQSIIVMGEDYNGVGWVTFWVEVYKDNCVMTDTINVWVDLCEGITENFSEINANLYPNPSNDGQVTLAISQVEKEMTYTVLDIAGRMIMKDNVVSDKTNLDLRQLSSGSYTIQLSTSKGVITKQLIITGSR